MRYLEQYVGEITQEEFEAVMGKIPLIMPDVPPQALVQALEVTPRDTDISCMIYLDQKPPDWLVVSRRWPGGVDIHRDWKYESVMAWSEEKQAYTNEWRYFMPVEISGGWYNPDAGEVAPFTFWLSALPGHSLASIRVASIGWKENHQHTNIYFTLSEPEPPDPEPPDPEPPDPEPPDPEPPCECKCEEAKQHIVIAQAHLDEAVCLLDGCACSCGEVT